MTRRSSNAVPMLVVALAAILLYFPIMIWLNASQAQKLLSRGRGLIVRRCFVVRV